jgi:hypothetical protein
MLKKNKNIFDLCNKNTQIKTAFTEMCEKEEGDKPNWSNEYIFV